MALPIKTSLKSLAEVKHTSLIGPFVGHEEKSLITLSPGWNALKLFSLSANRVQNKVGGSSLARFFHVI